MEFEGRITAVLPARTGKRQDGTEWIDLSFVFAYYENSEQRFEDSAIVSTFDTNIMAKIAPYTVRGADGKAVVENEVVKLNVQHIPCRCGFSLRVKTVTRKDGTGTVKIQESRCYRLEILPAANATGTVVQQQQPQQQAPAYNPHMQAPFPPQVDQYGNPITDQPDDLPF